MMPAMTTGDGPMSAAADPRADGAAVVVQFTRRVGTPVQGGEL